MVLIRNPQLRSLLSITRQSGLSQSLASKRFYSSEHKHDEHKHDEHHHEEEHGHHDEYPISAAESIFNKWTVSPFLVTLAAYGYTKFDDSYKQSHEGLSLVSKFKDLKWGEKSEQLYAKYQEELKAKTELVSLIAAPQKRDLNNYVVRIDDVPGKHFPFNQVGQFNTVDFETIAPRRKPINPFA
ncbi:unnamed protein product [[Candida] boidinii]|uniref:Unnamed protein product n=1 Tax=Candida boidinii TaxID=5477 RepID=A0A9W6WIK4_CANBO|nr:hypothetical protein B5S30_g588 [[Candida] boidinii]OWB83022.1 hypothetical protein B5S33_g1651 [[Candida] boidinii]GME74919.1 unnamed protein product [[Candida] boidinii]GMF06735.1 unnamed protein product [[Candida] boidinii]GMF52761.1 unnamed protein product [[Candida] boidinii]